jgi:hypothetical protein
VDGHAHFRWMPLTWKRMSGSSGPISGHKSSKRVQSGEPPNLALKLKRLVVRRAAKLLNFRFESMPGRVWSEGGGLHEFRSDN